VIVEQVKKRAHKGKRFSIVVIAEGARPFGGDVVIQRQVKESTITERLGGVGFALGREIEKVSGLSTRTVVMGHLLRGGSPSAFDRVLATELGTKAAEMAQQAQFGYMVGVKENLFIKVPLADVAQGPRLVPKNHPLIASAKAIGTCFGDVNAQC